MIITTVEKTINGAETFPVAGRYFRLLETVNPVDVMLGRGNQFYEKLEQVEAGAWAKLGERTPSFSHVRVTTAGSEAVKFVVSDGEAGYDRLFTALAQARTLTLPGNVTVGVAEVAVLAQATRTKAVFVADEANTADIFLGPVGVTTANGPIKLAPGDAWVETEAASAVWRAIAGAAGQTLRVMTAV